MTSLLDRLLGREKKKEEPKEQAPQRVDEEVARARREQLARERQEIEEARRRAEESEKERLAALEAEKRAQEQQELEKLAKEEQERLAAKAKAAEERTYVVKPGDSLSKIAKEVYGDANRWREIYEANKALIGDNPNLIHPGQNLRIP